MRKSIFIVALLAAVLIGFGYMSIFSTPASENVDTIQDGQEQLAEESEGVEKAKPVSGEGTFNSLILLGDVECVVSFTMDEGGEKVVVEGTAFASNDRFRADYVMNSPEMGGEMVSSVILKDDVFYTWSIINGQEFGAKLDTSKLPEGVESDSTMDSTMNQEVSYDCKPWPNVDYTVFEPPATVMFRDMNEITNSMMEFGTIYEEEI